MHIRYFSETTLCHLKPQQGLSVRHQQRAIDVTLAAKLTLTYGKYHLAMLHRELFLSEEKTSYQQAERMAAMMNQLTIIHSSPSDFGAGGKIRGYPCATSPNILAQRNIK